MAAGSDYMGGNRRRAGGAVKVGSSDFREIAEHHVPEKADTQVERILVDGADAVVPGEIRQTTRSAGRAYRARFALHVTVESGLVTGAVPRRPVGP
ncbi:hypothetical protein [Actinomadura bangladeshensis]|uniref:hypothetical protein n=1 Tax=Actinomadura bangladeshensis TaxID=453573 RepID=UPI001A9D2512|nr:hypothetical protein [Actinomadura bangladeshensis]